MISEDIEVDATGI